MNRLRFDLKTRPPVTERPEKESCGICRRETSRYTCPTCNVPYCSLTCFRSETHSECSETFYRKQIENDIKMAPTKSKEERRRMMDMLRRFEEESAREPDETTEDEDDDDLAHKLDGMDLEKAGSDTLWSILSPAQRDSFLKAMQNPTSELTQQLLCSVELQQTLKKPWWTSPSLGMEEDCEYSAEFGIPPRMMSIPRALDSPGTSSGSNHSLVYNVLALCLAYAYVTRRLSMSPLSALDLTDPDHAVARDLLSRTAPFVTERKSTLLFGNVDSLVTYLWSRLEALSDSPSRESFSTLLADGAFLFRPKPVSVIKENDPNPQFPHMALLAISDVAELFAVASAKLKHVLHKLNFYAANLCAQNIDVLKLVAEEAQIASVKMQSQATA